VPRNYILRCDEAAEEASRKAPSAIRRRCRRNSWMADFHAVDSADMAFGARRAQPIAEGWTKPSQSVEHVDT